MENKDLGEETVQTEAIRRIVGEIEGKKLQEIAEIIYKARSEALYDDTVESVFSKKAFMQEAQRYFSYAKRKGEAFAVGAIDVCNFKEVNDNFGHSAGDSVLSVVGEVLKNELREADLIGRTGGDEFAIVLVNYEKDDDEGNLLMLRLNEELKKKLAAGERLPKDVSITLGFAVWRGEETFKEVYDKADHKMYQKRGLRNE
jgi:diguanylate cyclase (GGDEF)-like protein